MQFYRVDRGTLQLEPCGSRQVVCGVPDCPNGGIPVEVADDGSMVVCGPCGQVIAEASVTEANG